MARELKNKVNVIAPDSDYPYGRIRDNNGTGNGTKVNENVYGDFHQFFAKMFDESGLTYNQLPDNDYSGFQYYEALQIVSAAIAAGLINIMNPSGLITKVLEIGPWDMTTATGTDEVDISLVGTGIKWRNVRSMNAIIRDDLDQNNYDFNQVVDDSTHLYTAFLRAGATGGSPIEGQIRVFWSGTGKAGSFDSSSFNDTSINRGWVVVHYIP